MSVRRIRNMEEFSLAGGISRPTLSKYFNDPTSVRSSTRQRIESALQEFNYRPNFFAINQNRKKPRNIGVIVPHISDPFYAGIVRQIEKRCIEKGYWAIILSSYGDRGLEAKAVQMLLSLKLSGAIVAPLGFDTDSSLIRSLEDSLPLVFLDSRIDDEVPFVGTDNRQSIALMVEYLCRTGEHPCYLDMPQVNQNAVERRDAYAQAMTALGIEPIIVETRSRSWNFEEVGYEEASAIFDKGGFPTRTVLCANDRLAFGVIAAAYQKGVRIGREPEGGLRVAGHDDHPLSRFTPPSDDDSPGLSEDCNDQRRHAARYDRWSRHKTGSSRKRSETGSEADHAGLRLTHRQKAHGGPILLIRENREAAGDRTSNAVFARSPA